MSRAILRISNKELEHLAGLSEGATPLMTCAAEMSEMLSVLAASRNGFNHDKDAVDFDGMSNLLLAISVVIRQADAQIKCANMARDELTRRNK